jgi:hypothetical protein
MMEFGGEAFASRETSSLASSRRAVVVFHAVDQMGEEQAEMWNGAADISLTSRLLGWDRVKGRRKTCRGFRESESKLEGLEISRVEVEVKVICFLVWEVVTAQRHQSRNLLLRWRLILNP